MSNLTFIVFSAACWACLGVWMWKDWWRNGVNRWEYIWTRTMKKMRILRKLPRAQSWTMNALSRWWFSFKLKKSFFKSKHAIFPSWTLTFAYWVISRDLWGAWLEANIRTCGSRACYFIDFLYKTFPALVKYPLNLQSTIVVALFRSGGLVLTCRLSTNQFRHNIWLHLIYCAEGAFWQG